MNMRRSQEKLEVLRRGSSSGAGGRCAEKRWRYQLGWIAASVWIQGGPVVAVA